MPTASASLRSLRWVRSRGVGAARGSVALVADGCVLTLTSESGEHLARVHIGARQLVVGEQDVTVRVLGYGYICVSLSIRLDELRCGSKPLAPKVQAPARSYVESLSPPCGPPFITSPTVASGCVEFGLDRVALNAAKRGLIDTGAKAANLDGEMGHHTASPCVNTTTAPGNLGLSGISATSVEQDGSAAPDSKLNLAAMEAAARAAIEAVEQLEAERQSSEAARSESGSANSGARAEAVTQAHAANGEATAANTGLSGRGDAGVASGSADGAADDALADASLVHTVKALPGASETLVPQMPARSVSARSANECSASVSDGMTEDMSADEEDPDGAFEAADEAPLAMRHLAPSPLLHTDSDTVSEVADTEAMTAITHPRSGADALATRTLPDTVAEVEAGVDGMQASDRLDGDETLVARLVGETCLGSCLTIELSDELSLSVTNFAAQWHRSPDGASWDPVEGSMGEQQLVSCGARPPHLLNPRHAHGRRVATTIARLPATSGLQHKLAADDVGCFLFAEWRCTSSTGRLLEGATEATATAVRLPVEDRDELKGYILAGEAYFSVSRSDGEACTLALKSQGVVVQSQQSATDPAVHHRIAATWADASFHANRQSARGAVLRWDPSREGARPDANAGSPTDDEAAEVLLLTEDERTRNLLMLTAQAFVSLTAEPSHRGACRVWEGDGYGMYIAELRGQILLLYDPPGGAREPPSEALLLHACDATDVDDEDADGFELSISDSNGEVFSLSLADAADRDTWRDALNSRVAPPAIARASHILLKNNASRRLASWRDPDGVDIRKRSESAAAATLRGFRAQIERGEATMEELAMRHSDCDTAKFGGDLGWFGAGYMQPEFEEAVLALEVGQLSDCVVSPSGVHLILRTG